MITNPPLNQNKTEGDLVNFSCEGEVTQTYQVKFSEICQLMRTSWKCVKRERFCEDVLRANKTQGTPGNLTISWYRDNIPIHSVTSMQGRVSVKKEGALIINPVKSEDAGTYVCEVTNGIGRPQRAPANLEVTCKELYFTYKYFRLDWLQGP